MIKINLRKRLTGSSGNLTFMGQDLTPLLPLLDALKGKSDTGEEVSAIKSPVAKIIVAFIVYQVASYGIDYYKRQQIEELTVEVKKLEKENAGIDAKLKEIKGFEPLKNQYEADEKVLRTKLQVIGQIFNRRNEPVQYMLKLSEIIPKEVWLTSFDQKTESIDIAGGATAYNTISDFLKALNESGLFQDVKLRNVNSGTGGEQAFRIDARKKPSGGGRS